MAIAARGTTLAPPQRSKIDRIECFQQGQAGVRIALVRHQDVTHGKNDRPGQLKGVGGRRFADGAQGQSRMRLAVIGN
jgi:hypothetical protein